MHKIFVDKFCRQHATDHKFSRVFAAFLLVIVSSFAAPAFSQAPPAAPPPPCNACPPPAPPPIGNVALGKFAYQSSTYMGNEAWRAVDGSANYAFGHVSMTTYELNPWWAVDLGATYELHALHIYLGGSWESGRTIHFGLFAWDDVGSSWYLITKLDMLDTTPYTSMSFKRTKTRYFLIQILGPNPDVLQLAEVKLWGF
jgi:hypothetical protein